jgi:histidinol-phosphate phosphatase family protein
MTASTIHRWTRDGTVAPWQDTAPGLVIDRDGTLTVERGYLADPDELEPIAGAVDAVARARAAGLRLAVVTNQVAVAKGHVTEEQLAAMHRRLDDLFGGFDAVYHCPHHYDDGCGCRKPAPGMVAAAIDDLHLDPVRTLLVGDHLTDCLAGREAGLAAMLVRTGHGHEHEQEAEQAGFPVVHHRAQGLDRPVRNLEGRP